MLSGDKSAPPPPHPGTSNIFVTKLDYHLFYVGAIPVIVVSFEACYCYNADISMIRKGLVKLCNSYRGMFLYCATAKSSDSTRKWD